MREIVISQLACKINRPTKIMIMLHYLPSPALSTSASFMLAARAKHIKRKNN